MEVRILTKYWSLLQRSIFYLGCGRWVFRAAAYPSDHLSASSSLLLNFPLSLLKSENIPGHFGLFSAVFVVETVALLAVRVLQHTNILFHAVVIVLLEGLIDCTYLIYPTPVTRFDRFFTGSTRKSSIY